MGDYVPVKHVDSVRDTSDVTVNVKHDKKTTTVNVEHGEGAGTVYHKKTTTIVSEKRRMVDEDSDILDQSSAWTWSNVGLFLLTTALALIVSIQSFYWVANV